MIHVLFFMEYCRLNWRRKIIIHHNQHRNHIQEAVQVGAEGTLEEEGLDLGVVVADRDRLLREVLAQMTHL